MVEKEEKIEEKVEKPVETPVTPEPYKEKTLDDLSKSIKELSDGVDKTVKGLRREFEDLGTSIKSALERGDDERRKPKKPRTEDSTRTRKPRKPRASKAETESGDTDSFFD